MKAGTAKTKMAEVLHADPKPTLTEGPKKRRKAQTQEPRCGGQIRLAPKPPPLRPHYEETSDILYIPLVPGYIPGIETISRDVEPQYDEHNKLARIIIAYATEILGYAQPVLANLHFKVDFDQKADCVYLSLPGIAREKTVQGDQGISFEYHSSGRLARITIASASSRLHLTQLGLTRSI